MNRPGTIRTRITGTNLVCGIFFVVIGVSCFVTDAAALAFASSSFARGDGGIGASGVFQLAVIGLLFTWGGIRVLRVGVQASAGKMTYRGYFWTRTVDASDIRAITLQPFTDGNREVWTPRVELTVGRSFWMPGASCGRTRNPPIPHRAATLDEIRALLGVRVDDARQPETLGDLSRKKA